MLSAGALQPNESIRKAIIMSFFVIPVAIGSE